MSHCTVYAITNQKGGVGKTTTTVNLGIGLAKAGKKVLLIDFDPQASLTASLGYKQPDELDDTISTVLEHSIADKPMARDYRLLLLPVVPHILHILVLLQHIQKLGHQENRMNKGKERHLAF